MTPLRPLSALTFYYWVNNAVILHLLTSACRFQLGTMRCGGTVKCEQGKSEACEDSVQASQQTSSEICCSRNILPSHGGEEKENSESWH